MVQKNMKISNVKKLFFFLGSFCLCSASSAQQLQEIILSYESSGDSHALVVKYNVSNESLTSGLGFRLHFNSNLVEVHEYLLFQSDSNLGFQLMKDTDDLDDDPTTDYFINAAWVDLSGYWPEVTHFPTELFTLHYDTILPGNRDLFSLSSTATASGFEFAWKNNY